MEIVEWLERDEVQKILINDVERLSFPAVSERDIDLVLDLMRDNNIKFYRETGLRV